MAAAAEDQKRLANRIAQRKFRRQRKDYIAQLERELAICKAGADAELSQRRKDVEKLRGERAELRSLLDHVVKSLQRICAEDGDEVDPSIPVNPKSRSAQLGVPFPTTAGPDPTAPREGPLSSSPGAGISPRESPGAVANMPSAGDGDQRDPTRHSSSYRRQDAGRDQLDPTGLAAMCGQRNSNRYTPQSPQSGINGFMSTHESLLWAVSGDSCDATMAQDDPRIISQIDPSGSGIQFNDSSCYNPCAPLDTLEIAKHDFTFQSNHAEPSSISSIHPPAEGNGYLLDASGEGDEPGDRNDGNHHEHGTGTQCPPTLDAQEVMRHPKLRTVEMLSMLVRRRTEALADCCIAEHNPNTGSLQVLNDRLNHGLVEIISMSMSMYLSAYKTPVRMYGGFSWVIWHILKSNIIIPRLTSHGVIDAATDFDETLDVLRDNTPHWLKPTEVQRSVL